MSARVLCHQMSAAGGSALLPGSLLASTASDVRVWNLTSDKPYIPTLELQHFSPADSAKGGSVRCVRWNHNSTCAVLMAGSVMIPF